MGQPGVAKSRLAHSIPEVLLGSVLGISALSLFVWTYLRDVPTRTYFRPLVTVSVMLVILLNGHDLRSEELLHRIANYLNLARSCSGYAAYRRERNRFSRIAS